MRLVSARWVIPVAAAPISEGAVILDDGVPASAGESQPLPGAARQAAIVAVGTRAELRRAHPGLPEQRAAGVLCPALVNAHAHLELSGLEGSIPGGDGLVNWTRRLVALAGTQPPEGLRASALAAASAARASGTVAMGDVGNGTAGWTALERAHLQGLFFHELVGSREARTGDALQDASDERARLPPDERPAHIPAVPSPHAPYSVGPQLMRRIFTAAARMGHPTTIHLAEDGDEVLLLRDGSGSWPAVLRAMGVAVGDRTPGVSPTAYLEALGAFSGGPPPLLVHMVHADADDRRRAREAGSTVVLCPRSNLHIGGRLPDVPALVEEGVRLAVGTDSLASSASLSLWEELETLAAHCPDVPPRTWWHAATRGGAAALGLPHLGALTAGSRPGLLDVGEAGMAAATKDPERDLLLHTSALRIAWMDGQPPPQPPSVSP